MQRSWTNCHGGLSGKASDCEVFTLYSEGLVSVLVIIK
jgi:hypothetical protein